MTHIGDFRWWTLGIERATVVVFHEGMLVVQGAGGTASDESEAT